MLFFGSSIKKYYDFLGLPYTASIEEVRAVYRKMAKHLHPDVNKSSNAEHEFLQLKKSYDALSVYIENGRQTQANTFAYTTVTKPKCQPEIKPKKTKREYIAEKLRLKFEYDVAQYSCSKSYRNWFLVDVIWDWLLLVLAIGLFLIMPIMALVSHTEWDGLIALTLFAIVFFLPITILASIRFNERFKYCKSILDAVSRKKPLNNQ